MRKCDCRIIDFKLSSSIQWRAGRGETGGHGSTRRKGHRAPKVKICDDGQRGPSKSEFEKKKKGAILASEGRQMSKYVTTDKGVLQKVSLSKKKGTILASEWRQRSKLVTTDQGDLQKVSLSIEK